jgi:hypothetical protein
LDVTKIRRQKTLQIQMETLGKADQKKKEEWRKAKYRNRIYPRRRNKGHRGGPNLYLLSS